jgi:acyl-CoA thioester hydrolase
LRDDGIMGPVSATADRADRPALVTAQVQIRWADEDAYGHVNNAVYLNYLEEARDQVVDDLFGAGSQDFVIAHVGIDYTAEITHRDLSVEVDSWVTGHGVSSVRTAEEIRKPDGTVAARAQTVLVPRDAGTGRSRRLRPAEVHALREAGSVGPQE